MSGFHYIRHCRGRLPELLHVLPHCKLPKNPMVSYRSQIPTGHRERMHLAEMSFFWHRVYDPRTKKCVHFCEAAPELMGTADVPALPSTAGGTAFLGYVSCCCCVC